MQIFPAIDLLDGQVVRLYKGNYDDKTVYNNDVGYVADQFIAKGAKNLHLVDLNGARSGQTTNMEAIKILCKKGLFIELGGGIRNEDNIKAMLDLGINRVILGTVAAKNPSFVESMVQKYGEAIAVGIDAKKGMVAVSGWEQVTQLSSIDFCKDMFNMGVKTIIYTDISKDGTLTGTNMEAYKQLNTIKGLNIVASGGISFIEEIDELSRMGIYGAILGKALYENKLDLKTAIERAKRIC
ncbi:MAG: 1-(5-phosphoribosyl)-5-[(5-phosphoribosylamino)methylideneamino]imidazole-4-carboxamide isomerase [Christensenellaceae bacterium]|nr:1-(5-phosphoribosyl)-5-[(5-phosphoribosylamino)methylideneamino]imidazole-4-carboxamide isomerase [Christensenellaceae bacterium]